MIPHLVITALLHGCETTPHYNRTKVVNVGTPLPKKPYGNVKLYQSKEEVPSSYDVIAIMSVEGKAGEEAQFIKAFLYRAADLGADAVIFYRVSLAAGTELGQRYISTSIFTLPSDFDSWPDRYDGVLPQHIEQMRRNLHARDRFVKWAIDAGYSDAAVYRPMIKRWILHSCWTRLTRKSRSIPRLLLC